MSTPLVVGATPWARQAWQGRLEPLGWRYAEEDYAKVAEEATPPWVFFFHWRQRVAAAFLGRFLCVGFHMTDLPFGRGGSPLQNLRAAGYELTALTAFRMTDEMDAGPVYLKRPLALTGAAEEAYLRAMRLAAAMAVDIAGGGLTPTPQVGPATVFHRRTPEQSRVPEGLSPEALATHIQMLDAEGYPPAFLEVGGYRLEFRRAAEYTGRVVAEVTITRRVP